MPPPSFSEVPHQKDLDEERRHIVWVLVGTQLLPCSVHSVRPVNETEKFVYETTTSEQPSQWRSLADVLPRREYSDLTDQIPTEDQIELPDLPTQPDNTTTVAPTRRLTGKQHVTFEDPPPRDGDTPVNARGEGAISSSSTTRIAEDVNHYEQPAPKKLAKKKRFMAIGFNNYMLRHKRKKNMISSSSWRLPTMVWNVFKCPL